MNQNVWEPQGRAMQAYINGNEEARLITYSNEGKQEIPMEIYFRSWESFPELEQYSLSLCQGKVLDVGAGSGCHALALQEMGLEVHCIDISPLAVEVMKQQGLEHVFLGDIFEMELPGYDTIVMFMNGIGFVGNLEKLELFLIKAKDMIKPDGQLIFDSTDLLIEIPEITTNNGYYGIVEYQLEYNGKKGEKFPWLFVDPQMLNKICKKTGWHCQVVYDDMDGHYLARLRLL